VDLNAVLGAHRREIHARSFVVSLEFSAVLLPARPALSRRSNEPPGPPRVRPENIV